MTCWEFQNLFKTINKESKTRRSNTQNFFWVVKSLVLLNFFILIIRTWETIVLFKHRNFSNPFLYCINLAKTGIVPRLQRWKSQSRKIHRLACRFSIDFSFVGLANGFLSQSPRFFFACFWAYSSGIIPISNGEYAFPRRRIPVTSSLNELE